jgi:hypothetical protein
MHENDGHASSFEIFNTNYEHQKLWSLCIGHPFNTINCTNGVVKEWL